MGQDASPVGTPEHPVSAPAPLPEDPANNVPWVGNTGVMLLEHAGLDLLAKAYDLGEYKDVPPGYGDQPAVNVVAWRENRVTRLEWKWN